MRASWTYPQNQPQELRNEIAYTEFGLRCKFVFADDRKSKSELVQYTFETGEYPVGDVKGI